jgi:hypothetical protein
MTGSGPGFPSNAPAPRSLEQNNERPTGIAPGALCFVARLSRNQLMRLLPERDRYGVGVGNGHS